MAEEWINTIKKGDQAFKQEKFSEASDLYKAVLAEAKRNFGQIVSLSRENIKVIQLFSLCTRGAGNALFKNGEVSEAENIYFNAVHEFKPFISNLNNSLLLRAMVLTEFKLIFYDLASLYLSNQQMDKFDSYVTKNIPLLKEWTAGLKMITRQMSNLN